MTPVRLVLVRHGDTVADSSVRYYGATDVVLSRAGRRQAERARRVIGDEAFGLVVASPLARAWQTATVLAPGQPIRLEEGFREVNFGEWEGLTREEIEARDPALFARWQQDLPDFDYPGGEARASFRSRIEAGLGRLLVLEAESALVVAHKGVIRTLLEALTGQRPAEGQPELGGIFFLDSAPGGSWRVARP
ncbi:MAG: histidine phosphatase family protein [Myxococcota bacterium]|nr:histidine phosphatase family protein [Myxococcota bacterium]